ncbi:MAG TPA: class E sortase [Glaciibacter sp.]|nr:class E sortase [Glaciibacter sp.]
MTDTARVPAVPRRRARRPKAPRRKVAILSVFGEVLITAGALVFLFLAWQLWWNDRVIAASQSDAAEEISQNWINNHAGVGGATSSDQGVAESPDVTADPVTSGEPVVATAPDAGEPIAVLYVPRFGEDYRRTIAEGVGSSVLNSTTLGIGHYPDTQMPGELGNFAIAAHRSAYGGGMHLINELRVGDPIYVHTADGYYTYRFRDLSYVEPTDIDVIAPVPNAPLAAPTDRIITLTSCNPLYSTDERIIAYGVLDSWQPTSDGPPSGLDSIIEAQAKA